MLSAATGPCYQARHLRRAITPAPMRPRRAGAPAEPPATEPVHASLGAGVCFAGVAGAEGTDVAGVGVAGAEGTGVEVTEGVGAGVEGAGVEGVGLGSGVGLFSPWGSRCRCSHPQRARRRGYWGRLFERQRRSLGSSGLGRFRTPRATPGAPSRRLATGHSDRWRRTVPRARCRRHQRDESYRGVSRRPGTQSASQADPDRSLLRERSLPSCIGRRRRDWDAWGAHRPLRAECTPGGVR